MSNFFDPPRILIVDDDPDIVANLADILDDLGYTTDTAHSPEDALLKLKSNEHHPNDGGYDLCLLDFRMPGLDGVQLYQRAQVYHPKLRAIMITAFAGDDGIERATKAGVWQVLQKPVDVPHLLSMVQEAVGEDGP